MGKSRHRRDDWDDDELEHIDRFKERREAAKRKLQEHEDALPSNDPVKRYDIRADL